MTKSKPKFCISAWYYGAINQVPALVKALLKEIPSAEIVYSLSDFHGINSNLEKRLKDLLDTQGIEYKPSQSHYKSEIIDIRFPVTGKEKDLYISFSSKSVSIPVDPLKFEKRVLLNEQEKESLRKKYKIKASNIFCAGSIGPILSSSDIGTICKALDEKYKSDFQFILVPRKKRL